MLCRVKAYKQVEIACCNQPVQYDNPVAYWPKIVGIPECVDMATVSMATELGHMSMQMQFF